MTDEAAAAQWYIYVRSNPPERGRHQIDATSSWAQWTRALRWLHAPPGDGLISIVYYAGGDRVGANAHWQILDGRLSGPSWNASASGALLRLAGLLRIAADELEQSVRNYHRTMGGD